MSRNLFPVRSLAHLENPGPRVEPMTSTLVLVAPPADPAPAAKQRTREDIKQESIAWPKVQCQAYTLRAVSPPSQLFLSTFSNRVLNNSKCAEWTDWIVWFECKIGSQVARC